MYLQLRDKPYHYQFTSKTGAVKPCETQRLPSRLPVLNTKPSDSNALIIKLFTWQPWAGGEDLSKHHSPQCVNLILSSLLLSLAGSCDIMQVMQPVDLNVGETYKRKIKVAITTGRSLNLRAAKSQTAYSMKNVLATSYSYKFSRWCVPFGISGVTSAFYPAG